MSVRVIYICNRCGAETPLSEAQAPRKAGSAGPLSLSVVLLGGLNLPMSKPDVDLCTPCSEGLRAYLAGAPLGGRSGQA